MLRLTVSITAASQHFHICSDMITNQMMCLQTVRSHPKVQSWREAERQFERNSPTINKLAWRVGSKIKPSSKDARELSEYLKQRNLASDLTGQPSVFFWHHFNRAFRLDPPYSRARAAKGSFLSTLMPRKTKHSHCRVQRNKVQVASRSAVVLNYFHVNTIENLITTTVLTITVFPLAVLHSSYRANIYVNNNNNNNVQRVISLYICMHLCKLQPEKCAVD